MANRYWVSGGTGNWNSTTNWSATSGGASGASVPGSSDAALLNASSGSGTVTLDISPTIQTLTCTGFTGTLAFGTNTVSLNSTGTIFTGATTMAVSGTPLIICTNSSATARTITTAAVTEANSISFRVTAGTGTIVFSAGSLKNLDFTDGTNPTGYGGALGSTSVTIYGDLKASTNMTVTAGTGTLTFAATSGTKTINTAGVTFDRPFTFNGVGGTFQLQAALTSGSTRTCTLTNGTLDLASYTLTTGLFSSSNSNVRTLAFGTGKIVSIGVNVTPFTIATATNLTVSGTNPLVEVTGAGTVGQTRSISMGGSAGESNSISLTVNNGADTINFTGSGGAFRNVSFVGFTGTLSISQTQTIYGNWNFGGVTVTTGTASFTFAATSGTKTIASNGVTFSNSITFNGVGGTWSLSDALSVTATLTLTNGTLTTNGYSVSCQQFSSSNTNARTLNLGASTFTLNGTPTWNIADPTNMTLNAGTSTITFSPTIVGNVGISTGGLTYNNFSFPSAPAFSQVFILTGNFTANNFTVTAPLSSIYVKNFLISAGANPTITGTLSLTGANGNQRILFKSYNTTVVSTVTANAVSLTDTDFQNITAAGASINWTGTRLGNLGGNTNITFAAGKNCYFNSPAGGNWSDNVWASTSGGAVATTNYPLAQDTAIFDNTGINSGSTVSMYANAPQSAGAVNFSALTNSITWSFADVSGFLNIYGDLTLASFVTVTGTAPGLRPDATRGTLNITSAGASFGSVSCGNQTAINSGYNVKFLDNFTTSGSFLQNNQNLDLNGKTLTCNTFSSTYSAGFNETRVVNFNAGNISVAGNGTTVWSCADLTGFSYTGTPTVNFTYSGSTGARTCQNGNSGGATELNVVNFNCVAGTDSFTFTNSSSVLNLNYTGFSGIGTTIINGFIYGNFTLSATQTIAASPSGTTFAATSGTKTITTNGVVIDRPLTFNGVGGTWALQDALTMGATNGNLTLTNGTLNSNGFNVAALNFALGSGTKTLTMGASTWSISGNWDALTNGTGFTINAGTSTINMNSASSKSFSGNSKTYYNLRQTGLGALSISGFNTFNIISNTVQPTTMSFEAASTQTVNNFNVSGTAGNLVTLNSLTPGTRWNLAKNTGGKVLVSYDSITDSAATPAGYWFAPTSQGNVDGGNNTGWNFGTAGGAGGFLPFF